MESDWEHEVWKRRKKHPLGWKILLRSSASNREVERKTPTWLQPDSYNQVLFSRHARWERRGMGGVYIDAQSSDLLHPSQHCSISKECGILGFSPPPLFLSSRISLPRGRRGGGVGPANDNASQQTGVCLFHSPVVDPNTTETSERAWKMISRFIYVNIPCLLFSFVWNKWPTFDVNVRPANTATDWSKTWQKTWDLVVLCCCSLWKLQSLYKARATLYPSVYSGGFCQNAVCDSQIYRRTFSTWGDLSLSGRATYMCMSEVVVA